MWHEALVSFISFGLNPVVLFVEKLSDGDLNVTYEFLLLLQ